MRLARTLAGSVIGLALGLAVTTANAAPAGSGLAGLKDDPSIASLVDKTYWATNCYWRGGRQYCNRYWVSPAPVILFAPRHRHFHHGHRFHHHRGFRR